MTVYKKTTHPGVRAKEHPSRKHGGKADKYFMIRYNREGKTISEGVGFTSEGVTPQYASNIRAEIIHNIRTGEGCQSMAEKRDAETTRRRADQSLNITLQTAFKDFKKTRTLKPRTISDYDKFMGTIFLPWKEKRVTEITRHMVGNLHTKLGESVGKAQANQSMRFLRSLLNFTAGFYDDAQGEPLIKVNPVQRLSQTKAWFRVSRRQTIIRNSDLPRWYKALMELENLPTRDYLLLLLFTGVRKTEGLKLETKDIDLENRSLKVTDPKNHKPLTLPIPSTLLEIIRSRVEANKGHKYLFPGKKEGTHLQEPKRGKGRVVKESGVEFCIQDLRRLFITTAESLDLSGYAIKTLVNHSTGSDTTAGYIVQDVERLRKPMEAIQNRILSLTGTKETAKIVNLKR
jgi:integrase